MVLRFILRYLANNERVIDKLAESKPVRRAARFVVYLLSRTSTISGSHRLPSDPKELGKQLKDIAQRFSANLKDEIQDAKEELKKRKTK